MSSSSDDEQRRRLSDLGRRHTRRRLTNWDGLRVRRPNLPPPGRHNAEAGSSLEAARGRGQAAGRGPPLQAMPPHENDSNKSFSSLESASTDDGEELARILDPDEVVARVLAKSLRSKRRDEKQRRAGAEFVEAMNEEALETGLRQDAEHTARQREGACWKEIFPSSD